MSAAVATLAVDCTTADHDQAKRDPRAWEAMKRLGEMDDGYGGSIELRNCGACNSTLARPVGAPAESPPTITVWSSFCAPSDSVDIPLKNASTAGSAPRPAVAICTSVMAMSTPMSPVL